MDGIFLSALYGSQPNNFLWEYFGKRVFLVHGKRTQTIERDKPKGLWLVQGSQKNKKWNFSEEPQLSGQNGGEISRKFHLNFKGAGFESFKFLWQEGCFDWIRVLALTGLNQFVPFWLVYPNNSEKE